jgi:uncharacterized protein
MSSSARSRSQPPIRHNWRRLKTPLFLLLAGLAPITVPATADAQVRLGPEATGANYSVQVMSWADIPFRTVVRQRYDFSCGSAAVATLLTYHYGRPTSEQQPFAYMWKAGDQKVISKAGFSMYDMKLYLESVGLKSEGYRMNVDGLRKSGRPAIVLLDLNGYKHFVVVKGVQGNKILVGDPIRGLSQYDAKDFEKSWNNIALAIVKDASVKDGSRKAPSFNLARDWSPWSTAPVDDNAQVANIGSITTHLPQIYQLTSQILIDARVGTGKE